MKTYSKNLETLSVGEAAVKLNVPTKKVIEFLKRGDLKFDPNITNGNIKIYKLDVRRLNQELLNEKTI